MAKQKLTVKQIAAWTPEKIQAISEAEARQAYRIMQQANNKRIKRLLSEGKWSPAMKLNWGMRNENTHTPQFKPQSAYRTEYNVKGALGGLIFWANKETSTLSGTKKWEKKVEKSISEKIGQTISFDEIEDIFNITERFKESFPEYLASGTSVLVDFVANEGIERVEEYIVNGQLTTKARELLAEISKKHQKKWVKLGR